MKKLLPLLLTILTTTTFAAEPPADWVAAGERRRDQIPLGGDFKPDPKVPAFVAVGHGARIVLSLDDGKTWKQVFWGYPGSDHGGWATNEVAYTNGVFAVPVGWTKPTTYLASEDGVNWRHLTDGKTPLDKSDRDEMPTTMSMAGGKGVFVGSGYTTFTATPDFGKSWSTFSLYKFKDDPRGKLVTHHIKTIYCGDPSGRFLAHGDNRGTEGPAFGHLFASDDLGKTWKWLQPKWLDAVNGRGPMTTNGKIVLLLDQTGENAYRSTDGGATWDGPHPTGTKRVTLSEVKGEFWLTGKPSRVSADGKTWRDLPATVPAGQVVVSDKGTLISIDKQRFDIQRSTDGGKSWQEVFTFKPETENVHGAQGLKDVAFGFVTGKR
jgi:photosystem II stability/assembly factor-like uncharacterized protein